ncbi:PaaI family thioesterase [Pseudomonas atacamensis]|uniref:PaaI family thioesterase n=1 Tax=Pseudomonas atacamensis TaxID=2565368 RepID=A0AAQ2D6V8_9PSED|nr:PaaI family thioesterase [Pseudomonas atacamensis]THF25770.1 PaaI family thioesterase [Pseudomonas atacamensis]
MNEALAASAFQNAIETYKQDFGTFFLARLLGLEITYTEDTCVVEMPVRDFEFNPQGSLHGGVIATILDISMGHLLNRQVGPGATLDLNVQYLKAARSGRLTATGSFIRKGRQICFLRSELKGDDGDLIASATSTWKVI